MIITQDKYLKFENGIYDDLNSPLLLKIMNLKVNKIIYTNKQIDLVTYEEYGYESWWHLIAYYNNIINPFDTIEREIKLPSHSDLLSVISQLKYNY